MSDKKLFKNGVPLFDQNGDTVNAHGACVLKESGKYYLFGEYKTDDVNKYIGFSCYSSADFSNWHFEGLALPPQKSGLLGPDRVGERVKVLKCPKTGKFIMLMHTDDMKYGDPHIGLAVSDTIDGEFTFVGPLLYQGQPIKMWDMGSFVDEDGTAYLLLHEGDIYRLSDDYTEAVELVAKDIAPGGESPAMFREKGRYFLMLSNKTSWERNDNYYFTATDPHGPWVKKGLFCPAGSLTYNTQCSFVFDYPTAGGIEHIYIGDRWSYPMQKSAATLVFLPITVEGDTMRIEKYMSVWSPDGCEDASPAVDTPLHFISDVPDDSTTVPFTGAQISVFGESCPDGGYANFEICDNAGCVVSRATVDFYSLVPDEGLRYVSPTLKSGGYQLKITVLGKGGVWEDKRHNRYGSKGCLVKISGYC